MAVPKIFTPYAGTRVITRRFGGNRGAYERFGEPGAPMIGHNGIDVAIPSGTHLFACVDGVITERRNDPTGYGQYGVITDAAGTQWLYGHAARWHVADGAQVTAGQHIADGDSTGNSTGHHLHFAKRPKGYNRADGYFGYVNPRQDLDLPYRVLLQAGHHPAAGGAPGEAAWTMRLATKVAALLRGHLTCEIVGDYFGTPPPTETHQDWDLYLSLHYDAHQPPGYTTGCSIARFEAELEHWEADRFVNLWLAKYPPATGIPLTLRRVGPNMTQYYGFRPLTAVTPGVIAEHGCGQGDDNEKLHAGLDHIAEVDAGFILAYFGIDRGGPGAEPEGELPMDTTAEERAAMQPYFEQLQIPVNMETALMKRAALAHKRQEGRGPALSGEYTARNRDGILVARQRFSGGTLDYHQEGPSEGQTFWGEVVAHPEDAL
jgi:hypothetical protein